MTTKPVNNKTTKQRPDLYQKLRIADKLTAISGWVMHGSTDDDVVTLLGVKSRQTLYNWKGKYPEFAEVMSKSKPFANGELLNSAFKKATGYDYDEDVLAKDGQTVLHLRKHVPADTGMLCFMLKNKFAPNAKLPENVDRFSDKFEQEVKTSVTVNNPGTVVSIPENTVRDALAIVAQCTQAPAVSSN